MPVGYSFSEIKTCDKITSQGKAHDPSDVVHPFFMCELLKRALVGRSHEGIPCRGKEEAYIKHKRYKNNIATKNYSDSIWIHLPSNNGAYILTSRLPLRYLYVTRQAFIKAHSKL